MTKIDEDEAWTSIKAIMRHNRTLTNDDAEARAQVRAPIVHAGATKSVHSSDSICACCARTTQQLWDLLPPPRYFHTTLSRPLGWACITPRFAVYVQVHW
jgi:hypothetical protein